MVRFEPRGKIYTVVRVLVGLVFIVNGPLGLIDPQLTTPDFYREAGLQFISALWDSGYVMYVVKVIETLVGVALLTNRFVSLALVVLAPVAFNIVAVNVLFSSPAMAVPPMTVLVALLGYLAFANRRSYAPLFKATTRSERNPDTSGAHAGSSGPARGEAL